MLPVPFGIANDPTLNASSIAPLRKKIIIVMWPHGFEQGEYSSGRQGGHFYVYNAKSELDAPGEYVIDAQAHTLSFFPPRAAAVPTTPRGTGAGTYFLSRLSSVIVAKEVANVTFTGFEIRHSRGGGVIIEDSTDVTLHQCTVADHGMMGMNVTGGARCGIVDSDVANNGDGGVILFGGDLTTLASSDHFASNITAHANQRWVLNYAPNVLLGGVGQRLTNSRIFDSPHIGVFFQGNDHVVEGSVFERLGRQCSDCGAFYMGRSWTYRGNMVTNNMWREIGNTIWGGASPAPMLESWIGSVFHIYLDDQLSSVTIEGNTFVGGHSPLIIGGGRHNVFRNNVINGTSMGVSMDNRGRGGTVLQRKEASLRFFGPRAVQRHGLREVSRFGQDLKRVALRRELQRLERQPVLRRRCNWDWADRCVPRQSEVGRYKQHGSSGVLARRSSGTEPPRKHVLQTRQCERVVYID